MILPVFYDRDMPSMATHCYQKECGYSLHKGVLIQWDEDHDERVIDFIDSLPASVRGRLLVIQEHEGSVGLVWIGMVPEGYEEGEEIEEPAGDIWVIASSKAVEE